MLARPGV